MERLDLYFSESKTSDIVCIGQIETSESWGRIKRLNLGKPKIDDQDIVIMDQINASGVAEDTELVSLVTARWLFNDFWKLPRAMITLNRLVDQARANRKSKSI